MVVEEGMNNELLDPIITTEDTDAFDLTCEMLMPNGNLCGAKADWIQSQICPGCGYNSVLAVCDPCRTSWLAVVKMYSGTIKCKHCGHIFEISSTWSRI